MSDSSEALRPIERRHRRAVLRFVDDPPTVTDLLAIAHTARLGEPASRMAWLLLWSLAHEGKDMSMQRRSRIDACRRGDGGDAELQRARSRSPWRHKPPEVYVTTVVQQDVPMYLDLVGQTQGFQDVDIRARVEGFLDTVNFREGSFVRRGDLLYQIDPKPLQATLAQANAELATARARLAKADNDVARYTPLGRQAGGQPAGARRRAGRRRTRCGRRSRRPRRRWRRRPSISATSGSRRRSTGWSARRR